MSWGARDGDGLDVGASSRSGPSRPRMATTARHFVDLQRDATVADLRRAVGRGLRYARARQALHDDRHRQRPGPDVGGQRVGIIADAHRAGRSAPLAPDHVPAAGHAGQLRAARRSRPRRPVRPRSGRPRPMPWHVAHGARVRGRRPVEAAVVLPARRRGSMDAASCASAAAVRERVGDDGRLDARQDRRPGAATPPRSSTASTPTPSRRSRSGTCRYGLMCRARRDGLRRRRHDAARRRPLLHDHDDRRCGRGARLVRGVAARPSGPSCDVLCTSVTDQWATVAIVGPRSRDVARARSPRTSTCRQRGVPVHDVPRGDGRAASRRASVRISFSGELAYEVNVPALARARRCGRPSWRPAATFGITPYGTEAMHVLRAEKGYVIVGQETDGTVTPLDLGLDWMVAKHEGTSSAPLAATRRHARGPTASSSSACSRIDPDELLPEGAQLVAPTRPGHGTPVPMSGTSPSRYRSAALAGRSPSRWWPADARGSGRRARGVGGPRASRQVTAPVFYDPQNLRRDG